MTPPDTSTLTPRSRRPLHRGEIATLVVLAGLLLLLAGLAVPSLLARQALARAAGDSGFPMDRARAVSRILLVESDGRVVSRDMKVSESSPDRCDSVEAGDRNWKVCSRGGGPATFLSVIYFDESNRFSRDNAARVMKKVLRVVAPRASSQDRQHADLMARARNGRTGVVDGARLKTEVLTPINVVVLIEARPVAAD